MSATSDDGGAVAWTPQCAKESQAELKVNLKSKSNLRRKDIFIQMLKRRVENSLSRLKVRFRGTPNGEASTKASSAAQNATSINANTLCAFCSSLFTTNHPILKTVDDVLSFDISEIHQSPTDFQQAVGQKCPLCMLRWNQLSDEEQTQVREVVKRIDLSISVDLKDNNIGIMYGYRLEDGGRRARTIIKNVDLVPDEGSVSSFPRRLLLTLK